MLYFLKIMKFWGHNQSPFFIYIRSHRRFICSSVPNAPQMIENFSNSFKVLCDLWKEKSNCSDIQNFLLFKCFTKESNCYAFTLNLLKYTHTIDLMDCKALNFAIVLALDKYLEQHVSHQPLTVELKQKALEIALNQKDGTLAKIIYKVFKIQEDSSFLREYTHKLVKMGNIQEACYCVVALEMQKEIPFDKILLPLALGNKVQLLIKYLHGYEDLQLQCIKELDHIIGQSRQSSEQKLITDKQRRTLCKTLVSLLKAYNINLDMCPNLCKIRLGASLNFLIHKKLENAVSETSWEHMVKDIVQQYPDLQKQLVKKLAMYGDVTTALQMAKKFNLSPNDWPQALLTKLDEKINVVDSDNENSSNVLQENGSQSDATLDYLLLDVNKVAVEFVETYHGFYECLNNINQNHEMVGIDSEWKAQFGLGPTRLSLMQLAVSDKVYILDLLALNDYLLLEDWDNLMNLFSSDKVLKLGCGIMQDVQMLLEDYRGTHGKKVKFSNLLDVAVLFEQFKELFMVELEEFAGDAPGTKGLSKLCKIILGKHLNKEKRICDWEIRPLSQSQVTYAALDAHCLLQMFEKIKSRAEENSLDFDHLMNIALDVTTSSSRIAVKCKRSYFKWERQLNSFSFIPYLSIKDFRIVMDRSLTCLGMKLRMYGADVTILEESQNYLDAIKLCEEENKIFLTTEEFQEKVKASLPEEKFHIVTKQARHDEKTVAYVFQKFNVHMASKAIYSRCMNCNGDNFLFVPPEELKKIWTSVQTKNLANSAESLQADDKHSYTFDGTIVNSNGEIDNGVQIQLKAISLKTFADIETFKICKTCGSIHNQR